jgi:hypothetical protein
MEKIEIYYATKKHDQLPLNKKVVKNGSILIPGEFPLPVRYDIFVNWKHKGMISEKKTIIDNSIDVFEIYKIHDIVCNFEGLKSIAVKSNIRKRELVKARHIVYYIAKENRIGSFRDIGNFYGQDHATVVHAWKTIKNEIDVYPWMRAKIEEITRLLIK